MESWKTWCVNAGLEKIVPGGLCINDSNIIIEAVRLGKASRWSVALWFRMPSPEVNWSS
jgi:hypothetical protein